MLTIILILAKIAFCLSFQSHSNETPRLTCPKNSQYYQGYCINSFYPQYICPENYNLNIDQQCEIIHNKSCIKTCNKTDTLRMSEDFTYYCESLFEIPYNSYCTEGSLINKSECLIEVESSYELICDTGFELDGQNCIKVVKVISNEQDVSTDESHYRSRGLIDKLKNNNAELSISKAVRTCPKTYKEINNKCVKSYIVPAVAVCSGIVKNDKCYLTKKYDIINSCYHDNNTWVKHEALDRCVCSSKQLVEPLLVCKENSVFDGDLKLCILKSTPHFICRTGYELNGSLCVRQV